MTDFESSIETTVRDLGTVTEEISRLRNAVAGHRDAASNLESIGTALSELSRQLARLPSDVQSQFSGVSQAVADLNTALRPAGALETAISELVAGNDRLLGQLNAERELLRSELQAFREDVRASRDLVQALHSEVRTDLSRIHDAVQERALASELAALASASTSGFSRLGHVQGDLRMIATALDAHSTKQAQETDAIKTRLAKLTGLARRGFFAILRGKDAPPEPL